MRGGMLYAVDDQQEIAMARDWFLRWIKHVTAMRSDGCGCCVEIFLFEASPEAIEALPGPLRQVVTAENLVAPLNDKVRSPFRLKAKERGAAKSGKRR